MTDTTMYPKRLSSVLRTSLYLFVIGITAVAPMKVYNLIPTFCGSSLETAINLKHIQLHESGDNSFVTIGAAVPKGTNITANYKCFVSIESPPGRGLILRVRKASLNDKDTIAFRSGTNPTRIWKENVGDESSTLMSEEVVTFVSKEHPSTISISYEPTVGQSPFNAGFDLAVTVYREKEDTCGQDFDCLNNRCISDSLRCDNYDNCGNNQDEAGCSGVSWLIVGILIGVAVLVVVLAILVWVRMSKA